MSWTDSEKLKRISLRLDAFRTELGAKVCVSSRPWNIFWDGIHSNPDLGMKRDTTLLAGSPFDQNHDYRELEQMLSKESEKLVHEVATQAQGVFLWVSVLECSR